MLCGIHYFCFGCTMIGALICFKTLCKCIKCVISMAVLTGSSAESLRVFLDPPSIGRSSPIRRFFSYAWFWWEEIACPWSKFSLGMEPASKRNYIGGFLLKVHRCGRYRANVSGCWLKQLFCWWFRTRHFMESVSCFEFHARWSGGRQLLWMAIQVNDRKSY